MAERNPTVALVPPTRATGAPLLEIEDLRVYYRTVSGIAKAVDGVNLTVERGEILGIAGESGSGKSTLAGALLRLIRPPGYVDGGRVVLRPASRAEPIDLLNTDDTTLRQIRWRHLSYIPQGSMNSLNPVMRIVDQFADVMVEHGATDAKAVRQAVPELLGQVGLGPHVARMFPHELSGGMKQRVIIAMAISLKPDLVIADEPTTALDVNVQRVMIQTLAELREQLGVSLIVVTHDMAVHAELVDRVAVMYAGDVVEVGEVKQIFKSPRHPYTQGLIGAIPRVGGERHRLQGIAGNAPSPRSWPSGCRFHPRCPYVMEICRTTPPRALTLPSEDGAGGSATSTRVSCHLYNETVAKATR
jgi:peptide/nickel transport system ATP-binding protein